MSSSVNLEQALVHLARADYQQALDCLADTPSSDNAFLTACQAGCHLALGQFSQAQSLAEQALRLNPDELEALLVTGIILLSQGQQETAFDSLYRAYQQNPQRRDILLPLAGLYYTLKNDVSTAIELFKAVLKQDPYADLACFQLGQLYFEQGQNAQAIEQLNAYVALNTEDSEACFAAGILLFEQGHYAEASAVFQHILHLEPREDALYNLFLCCLQREQYAKAREIIQVLIEHVPDNTPTYCYNAAVTCLRQNQPAAAIPYLKQTLQHAPEDLDSLALLQQCIQACK